MDHRLRHLVAVVTLIGAGAEAAVASLVNGDGPVAPLPVLSLPVLLPLLLLVTLAGDLVAVRVRHGESTEELTLFEAAVVVDALVLPVGPALLIPVAASLLSSLIRRRNLPKTAFNAGNLGIGTAALVAALHLLAGPGQGVSARTVLGLAVGASAFTAINLVALSRVLALVGGDTDPWAIVRDGARLSAVMAAGTVALGGTVVTAASAAPALVPFTLMPAAALMFAYRAAAQESEERDRSSRLLALSHLLARRLETPSLLAAFLELCRQAFGADTAQVLLAPDLSQSDDSRHGAERRSLSSAERRLLAETGPARLLAQDLPPGWAHALAVPLDTDGGRAGLLLIGTRERRRRLGTRELGLLTPLGSALAVAMRAGEHLARVTEETQKLKAVVDGSSDGILVLDGDGTVSLWSPALEVLSGVPQAVALGRRLPHVLATRTPEGLPADPFRTGAAGLTPGSPQSLVELLMTRPDGEERVVRCAHAGVFAEGALVRDVVIVHDVTRDRQVERMKADFIATVSHELRTPVTPIKGYADLLRRRGDDMTPEKRRECLDVIVDRSAHLARLVEDLLLASRISATEGSAPAQVQLRDDDLNALVLRAVGDFGTQSGRVRLHLPEHPVPIRCDSVRVVQILGNLVSNALKYSGPESPVDVRITRSLGRAVVEVEDQGRGIPTDQVEKVFEKFHRVEDPMRMTTGGTGLGLYIARQLAAAMGGTLHCRSTLGVGSSFSFGIGLGGEVVAPRAAPDATQGALEGQSGT